MTHPRCLNLDRLIYALIHWSSCSWLEDTVSCVRSYSHRFSFNPSDYVFRPNDGWSHVIVLTWTRHNERATIRMTCANESFLSSTKCTNIWLPVLWCKCLILRWIRILTRSWKVITWEQEIFSVWFEGSCCSFAGKVNILWYLVSTWSKLWF